MFTGEFYCKIDAKGRLILPIKFRDKLQNTTIVLTRGYDKNIEVYTMTEWGKILENMEKLNILKKSERMYKHYVLSGAHEVEIDSQGRINIPQSLMEFSSLKKEVAVIGNFSSLQIWDKEKWNNYINDAINDIPDILKELGE